MASDRISENTEEMLHLFDANCAAAFPDSDTLTQPMVDAWFVRRPTECANSCRTRCFPVASLVRFLRSRGETDVVVPEMPRREASSYVPHAFTDDELSAFFLECDAWEPARNMKPEMRVRTKNTPPVLFRLLWSSGIRTCEARLLRREMVDLDAGVLRIVEGKGRNERLVALHESMLAIMRGYDDLMEEWFPGRSYFFPNGVDGHLTSDTLGDWFHKLWSRVSDEPANAYELRHCYCVTCINELVGRGVDGLRDLEWVSKAMGHSSVEVTIQSYYHFVPALAEILQARSDAAVRDVLPGVVRHGS